MTLRVTPEDTPNVWPPEARRNFRLRTPAQRAAMAQGDRELVRQWANRAVQENSVAIATAALALAEVAAAEEPVDLDDPEPQDEPSGAYR